MKDYAGQPFVEFRATDENIEELREIFAERWTSEAGREGLHEDAIKSRILTVRGLTRKQKKREQVIHKLANKAVKECLRTLRGINHPLARKTQQAWEDARAHVVYSTAYTLNEVCRKIDDPTNDEEVVVVDTRLMPLVNGFGIAIQIKDKRINGSLMLARQEAEPSLVKAWDREATPIVGDYEVTVKTVARSINNEDATNESTTVH